MAELPGVEWLHYRGPVRGLPASIVPLEYGIAMVEGGYGVTHRGESRQVNRGVYGIQPGESISFHRDSAKLTRVRSVVVHADAFRLAAEEHGLPRAELVVSARVGTTPGLILAAESLWQNSAGACALGVQSAYFELLRRLFELSGQAPVHDRLSAGRASVERAKDCILSDFSGDLTLDQLAHESGITKGHFVRAFRQAVGMTPHAYLMHVRVERARQLLRAGRQQAEVATEVGFFDQSHLHRWFVKVMGVSPSSYVKADAPSRVWL